MTYVYWLAGLSVIFVVIERLKPRQPDPGILRPQILTDLFYLVFNGHFLGVLIATLAAPLLVRLDASLTSWDLYGWFYFGLAEDWPLWAQIPVALVGIDFLHWNIHRMLHAVPWLWNLHKVHHSAPHLDFIVSLRFHWAEIVVYKSLTYPLLALLGFSGEALFALAVINTAVGHFNHANLDVHIGPLKYVLNNPAMHVWHHVHPDHGPLHCNFGITLSLWDWIFGTAHMPDHHPARLGFEHIEDFPTTPPGQLLLPLPIEAAIRKRRQPETP